MSFFFFLLHTLSLNLFTEMLCSIKLLLSMTYYFYFIVLHVYSCYTDFIACFHNNLLYYHNKFFTRLIFLSCTVVAATIMKQSQEKVGATSLLLSLLCFQ